jgi:hypothetical protein
MDRRVGLFLAGLVVAGCKAKETPPQGATGDTIAGTPAQPTGLTVLSPTAGAAWLEGQSYVIRWRGSAWPRINIGAAMGGKDKGHLVENYSAALDTLSWTIPPGFISGFGLSVADNIRLRFENADDPGQFVDSDSFTIKLR